MTKYDVAGELQTKAIQFTRQSLTKKQAIEMLLEIKREIATWIKELKKDED